MGGKMMNKCKLCEFNLFCEGDLSNELCESFKYVIREQGGLDKIYEQIWIACKEAIERPSYLNKKIELFNPEELLEPIEISFRERKRYI